MSQISEQRAEPGRPDTGAGAVVVEFDGVTQSYGAHQVLHDFSLQVTRGELVALLGPSGSGKTTALRILAGFLTPDSGRVRLDGKDVTRTAPNKRGIGLVFQSYALFPHLTVEQNIAYPLKVQGTRREQVRTRVTELLELVRLDGQGHKKPARLSGGQQQRVALARALAMGPEVLLLDEPLSNLDANLRRDVGEEIRRLQQRTGTTAIMVTHDRQEAFGMADRIAVLRGGRIEQLGTPRELYTTPATPFMARFVGEANLIPGTVERSDGGLAWVRTAAGTLPGRGQAVAGESAQLLVRPEDLHLVSGTEDGPRLQGRVVDTFYYGSSLVAEVETAGVVLTVDLPGSTPAPAQESVVTLGYSPEVAVLVPGGDT
ncbi:ABC transporter ATP-binding protein [Ornithinimicrobium cavernae]|uniref:ABC transporter ATP-binding protein n=1 Tax=Ornithinimicrobium cavernae TaxID=2666047 RepID=UPI00192A6892|nr:ABC transporter ATP-binding protein [Ornithinimicrobium cavernae]